jgi:uncharacterized membrane protein YfhO
MQDIAFDPAAVVILSSETLPKVHPSQEEESVRVTHYAPERVEIEVEAQAPGYLVLTDAWYPGWQASVDGEPTQVHRVDLLFRAVGVDAGHHRVVFTFRPVSLWVGAGVSLVGLFILVAIAGLALSKARRGDIMGRDCTREGKR